MSINTFFTHSCEAWEPQNFVPADDSSSSYDEFFIEIFANFRYLSIEGDDSLIVCPTIMKRFRERRDQLINSRMSWLIISNMLSQMNVPYNVQPFMIHEISQRAREIANEPENKNTKTIPMIVFLNVEECIEDSQEFRLAPATNSSIEALEKVRVKNFTEQCVICLEEILIGSEATLMPCSHVYHQECIVNWLEKSNLCPLCRFQMPVHYVRL